MLILHFLPPSNGRIQAEGNIEQVLITGILSRCSVHFRISSRVANLPSHRVAERVSVPNGTEDYIGEAYTCRLVRQG
jgi:hypothetical protein